MQFDKNAILSSKLNAAIKFRAVSYIKWRKSHNLPEYLEGNTIEEAIIALPAVTYKPSSSIIKALREAQENYNVKDSDIIGAIFNLIQV